MPRRSNGATACTTTEKKYTIKADHMFEHLINGEFHPAIEEAPKGAVSPIANHSVADQIDAKVKTTDWLKEIGAISDEDVESVADAHAARAAFAALATQSPIQDTKLALTNIKTPKAVQHLVGMLTAYDWAFIEQAKEIRGYTVAQILEETKNPDTKFRLKALEMLGKVTEVALFTERIEVKKTQLSDTELEQRIKEKLNKFMNVLDVVDVTPLPDEPPNADIIK